MSATRQTTALPAGFFVMRAPLLSFDEWLAWGRDLTAAAAMGDEQAQAADAALLRARLRAALARPVVRDALFVASPDLEASLGHWLDAPTSERGQKVERALVRYFARMAGRATPFGLFAGCSVGGVGGGTSLAVAPMDASGRHTRLDIDYLFALIGGLTRDPELRSALRYVPNSSLYAAGGRLRYSEARLRGRQRSYHLVAVDPRPALLATIERAGDGASAAELAAALVAADPAIGHAEAAAFVDELIAAQVLVLDLAVPVTGPEPLAGLVARLRAIPPATPAVEQLDRVRAALAALDRGGPGAPPERYSAVAALLEGLPAKNELPRLFQVDLCRHGAEPTLSAGLAATILAGAGLLHRIAGSRHDGLTAFRKAFKARYETREVPLLEALDEETGIGFGAGSGVGADAAHLLGGLAFPGAPADVARAWAPRHAVLLAKLAAAARAGAQVIELTPADVDAMAVRDPLPLPDSFAAMVTLIAPSVEALARDEAQIVLESVAGPSGARLLGRFCHADPALAAHVGALLRAEEALDPEAIFAEVVYLPEGRAGNVICRPSVRGYAIPFLGQAGAPCERQIPAADLLLSVVAERIVLRSARLGRRVVPRLTSAHNFRRGPAPYRFLGALQNQGVSGALLWDWGPLSSVPFLPRVVSGPFVLARARWLIPLDELRRLGEARGAARFAAVQAWRAARGLPRLVLLEDGDNELPVDLDNLLSVSSFVELVKGRGQIALVELLPGPDELCAEGAEGRFVHELVVPFTRQATAAHLAVAAVEGFPREQGRAAPFVRSFPPGSEWLYVKLYCGQATADHVLREVVAPLVRDYEARGLVRRWFFLRYSDPEPHLRVRLFGDPAGLAAELLPALHRAAAPLVADGRIWRVQLDTYEREVERYGGPLGVELAERLFHADSAAALRVAQLYGGDSGAAQRWRLALCGMDLLLRDLGYDAEARRGLAQRGRDSFARELHAGADLGQQLGAKYRQQRANLAPLLGLADAVARSVEGDPPPADAGPLAGGLVALWWRSARLAPIVAELREAEDHGRLGATRDELALSFLHLQVNRLLRSAQRRQELVLYEFLVRLYTAQAARLRQAGG